MFDGVETYPYPLFKCIGANLCENTVSFFGDPCSGLFYVPLWFSSTHSRLILRKLEILWPLCFGLVTERIHYLVHILVFVLHAFSPNFFHTLDVTTLKICLLPYALSVLLKLIDELMYVYLGQRSCSHTISYNSLNIFSNIAVANETFRCNLKSSQTYPLLPQHTVNHYL